MPKIKVLKFGGSSVALADAYNILLCIVNDDPSRKVVVVSALGKKNKADSKVTDILLNLAATPEDGALFREVIARHSCIFPSAVIKPLRDDLASRLRRTFLPRSLYVHSIASWGEEICARGMAHLNGWAYVDAKELFDVSLEGKILPSSRDRVRRVLKPLIDSGKVICVPGFYGAYRFLGVGITVTLGRNSSDTSGAFIASSLDDVGCYENFNDVPGVFSANPSIVKDPKLVERLTFGEMRDLAYLGSSVFHPSALEPVVHAGVPVHIRSTTEYPKDGTFVVSERKVDSSNPIVGVACSDGFSSIDIADFGLNDRKAVGYKVLGVLADHGLSYDFMPGGIDDFSVVLRSDQFGFDNEVKRVVSDIASVLGLSSLPNVRNDIGCIVVAGLGLKEDINLQHRIYGTLTKENIRPLFVTSGSGGRSFVYGISESDCERAVNAIYHKHIK